MAAILAQGCGGPRQPQTSKPRAELSTATIHLRPARDIQVGRSGGYDTLRSVKRIDGRVLRTRLDTVELSISSASNADGQSLRVPFGGRAEIVTVASDSMVTVTRAGVSVERRVGQFVLVFVVIYGLWALMLENL